MSLFKGREAGSVSCVPGRFVSGLGAPSCPAGGVVPVCRAALRSAQINSSSEECFAWHFSSHHFSVLLLGRAAGWCDSQSLLGSTWSSGKSCESAPRAVSTAGFTAWHKRLSLPCLPAAALLALQLSRALAFIPREKNAYTNGKKEDFIYP